MKFLPFLALIICLLAGACNTTDQGKKAPEVSAPQIPKGSRIFIRLPEKFVLKSKEENYVESGGRTADALQSAFLRRTSAVFVGKEPQDLTSALETAREKRCDYMVFPVIVKWEDHATEWTGRRDKLEVRVSLYEAATGQSIYEKLLEGRSRWMTDGGDQPQDMLPGLMSEFVDSLFLVQHVPSAFR